MITSIRLVNFKNFADETLRVGPFTVIVGGERQRQEQYPGCLPDSARHRAGLLRWRRFSAANARPDGNRSAAR